MSKILSQSGVSLADMYDVEGSIAGIDHLDTHNLPIVHEMGGTLFSERLSGEIVQLESGSIAQSTAFDVVLTALPPVPTRILGVMLTSNQTRLEHAVVCVRTAARSPGGEQRELPIFVWDATVGGLTWVIRIDTGGGAAAQIYFQPSPSIWAPSMLFGRDQPLPVDGLVLRGITTAFGAGTADMTAHVYLAFPDLGGVSSHGVPVPSW